MSSEEDDSEQDAWQDVGNPFTVSTQTLPVGMERAHVEGVKSREYKEFIAAQNCGSQENTLLDSAGSGESLVGFRDRVRVLDSAGSSGKKEKRPKRQRSGSSEWEIVQQWILEGRDCRDDSAGESGSARVSEVDASLCHYLLDFQKIHMNEVSADLAMRQHAMQEQEGRSAKRVAADEAQGRARCEEHTQQTQHSLEARALLLTNRENTVTRREEAVQTEEVSLRNEQRVRSLDERELASTELQAEISGREAQLQTAKENFIERLNLLRTRSVRSRLLVCGPASFRGIMVDYGELT